MTVSAPIRFGIATACALALVTAALGTSLPARAAGDSSHPSVRLIRISDHATWYKKGARGVYGEATTYVGARGGTWEVWGQRPDYRQPIEVSQVVRDPSGSVVEQRALPEITLTTFGSAFPDFTRLTLRNSLGDVVVKRSIDFCPNDYNVQRLSGKGPANPTFPEMCWANPFTTGMVWGIDKGWATQSSGGLFTRKPLPTGAYELKTTIASPYREAFDVASDDASVTMHIDIVRAPKSAVSKATDGAPTTQDQAAELTRAPSRIPGPGALPDLASLPAWGMNIKNAQRSGKSYLNFGATVWNKGPSPLVVEGFREPDVESMKAYQYFYKNGEVVGRNFSGRLEYDHDAGHDHWHFKDFASYSLLDAAKNDVRLSGKESFCLAPTDIIDLTVPEATYRPWLEDLGTACGEPNSLWIREVLQAGWGDTYAQYRPGQSFNITNLPNGKYFVRVLANPDGRLQEVTDSNNVTYRRIYLRGTAGDRRVVVPPYQGIDTESGASCSRYC
jgi:Lysyl oxidase